MVFGLALLLAYDCRMKFRLLLTHRTCFRDALAHNTGQRFRFKSFVTQIAQIRQATTIAWAISQCLFNRFKTRGTGSHFFGKICRAYSLFIYFSASHMRIDCVTENSQHFIGSLLTMRTPLIRLLQLLFQLNRLQLVHAQMHSFFSCVFVCIQNKRSEYQQIVGACYGNP